MHLPKDSDKRHRKCSRKVNDNDHQRCQLPVFPFIKSAAADQVVLQSEYQQGNNDHAPTDQYVPGQSKITYTGVIPALEKVAHISGVDMYPSKPFIQMCEEQFHGLILCIKDKILKAEHLAG